MRTTSCMSGWTPLPIYYSAGLPDEGTAARPDHLKTHWPADLHVIGKDIVRFRHRRFIGQLF